MAKFFLCHHNAFVIFNPEMAHDEVAAFRCVFAHIESQHTGGVEVLVQQHRI